MGKSPDNITSENLKAIGELIERIKASVDRHDTTEIDFTVILKNGMIVKTKWNTVKKIRFE